jgi:ribosomal protein S18 acetylase RimI-like enzyme
MTMTLSATHLEDIVSVLCDAFRNYPVMRYALGSAPQYEERLRTLVGLFASARACRNEPMIGIRERDDHLVAVAIVTLPQSPEPPTSFLAKREAVWRQLGDDARARYEAFSAATQTTAIAGLHHHLNMLGVRRTHQGRGLARLLITAVQELSSSHEESTGVSLTTEDPANIALYEHLGYRVHGHVRVADTLETWTLFRPRT